MMVTTVRIDGCADRSLEQKTGFNYEKHKIPSEKYHSQNIIRDSSGACKTQ